MSPVSLPFGGLASGPHEVLGFGLDPGCSIALPDGGGNPCRLGQAIKGYIDVAPPCQGHFSVSAFSVNGFWQSVKDMEESGPGKVKHGWQIQSGMNYSIELENTRRDTLLFRRN